MMFLKLYVNISYTTFNGYKHFTIRVHFEFTYFNATQPPHQQLELELKLKLESFMCQGKSLIMSLICVWLNIVKY